jgi:mannose-6-phosphate isomerase-like protein (cupin superfamily)
MSLQAPPRYSIRRVEDAPTVPCPCGQSTRIVTQKDGLGCSFHITQIFDSVRHYHKECTEIYYILEGTGKMDLDDASVDIEPGLVITIPAGTRHRLYSAAGVKTIVFGVPAFNPDDEHFD